MSITQSVWPEVTALSEAVPITTSIFSLTTDTISETDQKKQTTVKLNSGMRNQTQTFVVILSLVLFTQMKSVFYFMSVHNKVILDNNNKIIIKRKKTKPKIIY